MGIPWLEHRGVAEAVEVGTTIQDMRSPACMFALDFRPHTHHWIAMSQVRAADTASGVVPLDGADATVFMTTWGDGVWEVFRDLDDNGELVRVRVELGTDEAVARMQAVQGR